jgi:hypothetical protein
MSTKFDLTKVIDFTKLDDDEYVASMNLKKMKKSDTMFVLKYNKTALNAGNVETLGLFRSVVVQKKDDKFNVVSFAPPKSVGIEHPAFADGQEILFTQFIEGTMVNVFFDEEAGDWEIATRSLIGGKGKFFKDSLTFRQMFLEALNETPLEFEHLNKKYCYSFAVQHPKNRIVLKIEKPDLVLCSIYECNDNVITEHNIYDSGMGQYVHMPFCYPYPNQEQAKAVFANASMTPFYVLGIMMKTSNGLRAKIRNPNYEYVHHLRGNQPKSQFQYLNLRHSGKVAEFLKFYPDFAAEFQKYRDQVHEFTGNLHQFYLNCYARKEKPLGQYPYEYRGHMYNLHQKYITELIPNGERVTKQVVVSYINQLPPPRLMYSLNFKYREMKKAEDKHDKNKSLHSEDTAVVEVEKETTE